MFGGMPLNLDTRGTKDEKSERSSLLHFKHREWKRLAGTPLTSTASPVEWSSGLSCLSTLVSAVRVFFFYYFSFLGEIELQLRAKRSKRFLSAFLVPFFFFFFSCLGAT